jgi:hypothetical protein
MISSWSPAAHLAKFCAQHLNINVGVKMIGSPPRASTQSAPGVRIQRLHHPVRETVRRDEFSSNTNKIPTMFDSSEAPRTQRWHRKVISMAVGSHCDGSPSAADRAATTFSH